MARRAGVRSPGCSTTIWSFTTCVGTLFFPFAGGSSAESAYSFLQILSTSFLGSAGRPGPVGTRLSCGAASGLISGVMLPPPNVSPLLPAVLPFLTNVRSPIAASSSGVWATPTVGSWEKRVRRGEGGNKVKRENESDCQQLGQCTTLSHH